MTAHGGIASHAALVARQAVPEDADEVLVVHADTPLLRPESLLGLLTRHELKRADLSLLTAQVEHAAATYGRIVREDGRIVAIAQEGHADGPAEVNVGGSWHSSDWGKAFLAQNDRTVNGYLGDYIIEGVVSGRKAYLLARDGDWYYYTIVLEMPAPQLLLGYYSRSIPYRSGNRGDIRLDRRAP